MSIITRFLAVVTEPQFKLARDLMAMAIADGEVTYEERTAMSTICKLEGIDEAQLMASLRGGTAGFGPELSRTGFGPELSRTGFGDAEGGSDVWVPQSRQEKEAYLRDVIKLIGADGYAAPEEVYLFQIIAGRMGLNQMDVVGLFLLTATRNYFQGDAGARILASFLKNHIAPKSKTERANRESLRTIYDTVAKNTEVCHDEELDRELLRQNLARATETFLENELLMKEFADIGLNFATMLKEEEELIFRRYCSF